MKTPRRRPKRAITQRKGDSQGKLRTETVQRIRKPNIPTKRSSFTSIKNPKSSLALNNQIFLHHLFPNVRVLAVQDTISPVSDAPQSNHTDRIEVVDCL